jgi:hypothetical protein
MKNDGKKRVCSREGICESKISYDDGVLARSCRGLSWIHIVYVACCAGSVEADIDRGSNV